MMYEVLENEVNARFLALKCELRKKGLRQLEFLKVIQVIEGGQSTQELLAAYLDSDDSIKPSDTLIDAIIPREIVDFVDTLGLSDPGLRELLVNFLSLFKSNNKRLNSKARSLIREQILREQALASFKKNDLVIQLQLEADLERVTREVNLLRASGVQLHYNECMSIIALMTLKFRGLGIQPQDLVRYANQHVPLDELFNENSRRSEIKGKLVIINEELAQAEQKHEVVEICLRHLSALRMEEWERLLRTHIPNEDEYKFVIETLKRNR